MINLAIIGNLGGDAESKNVNGQFVLSFSVAHSYTYTNKEGQKVNASVWVRCNYWVKKDNLSQYLKKGTMVYASGMPSAHAFQRGDKSLGSSLELRVGELQLLGGRKDNNSNVTSQEHNHLNNDTGGAGPQHAPTTASEITEPMDDLPF